MNTVLTIAGSDSSGGAGIQADIKTITINGAYAMSAVTALTAQNTTGVTAVMEVSPDFLTAQIAAAVTDIPPDAVKTGMVPSAPLIHAAAEAIKKYRLFPLVVDPVMVATSGARLISDDAVETLKAELLQLAAVITPNIGEAEVLSGITIASEDDMEKAARIIEQAALCAVLVKGGHEAARFGGAAASAHHGAANTAECSNDFLFMRTADGKECARWFRAPYIDNPNTHGTGCTLSSAIASFLAKGLDVESSIDKAKAYVSRCLEARLDLGHGSGPLMHNYRIAGEESNGKD